MSQGDWVTAVSVVLAIGPAVTGIAWLVWLSRKDR